MNDIREVLDPRFQVLSRERSMLTWDVSYCELIGVGVEGAEQALSTWDSNHAEEWNRLKPWYEIRLNP